MPYSAARISYSLMPWLGFEPTVVTTWDLLKGILQTELLCRRMIVQEKNVSKVELVFFSHLHYLPSTLKQCEGHSRKIGILKDKSITLVDSW